VVSWASLAVIGIGLAVASFVIAGLVLFWSRGAAPHYWQE
jgi:hypothetical protein